MLGRAHPSVALIELATCVEFDVRLADMRSRRRGPRSVCLARHVAIYLARERTPYSLPHIGRLFDRDHTTVMYAIDKIAKLSAKDPQFAAKVRECGARL